MPLPYKCLMYLSGPSDETSPEEDGTVSSASLCMSPTAAAPAPLYASTPYGRASLTNGHDVLDARGRSDSDVINGNAHVIISESMNSMDVLSGGESDAGDTLSRRNNNSISSSLLGTLKESTTELPRRRNCDIAYFVAKELLMTERTYKRDLELVTVTWSQKVSELTSEGVEVVATLARACLALEPLALPSGALLAKLERMLSSKANDNEEPEYKKIAEVLYDHLSSTADAYSSYISGAGTLSGLCESVRRSVPGARAACAAFDAAAPLPLACLLLRPLHRVLHLLRLAEELHAGGASGPVRPALELASTAAQHAREQLRHVENHLALCQLQRDIAGYDKLLVAEREFVRMGCLYKHSTRGLQQRMLFLFTDVAVVTSRAGVQFRAHAAFPLQSARLAASDLPHSFTLAGPDDLNLLLSASNEHEFLGWWRALERAIEVARDRELEVDTQLTPYEQDVEWRAAGPGGGGGLAHVCWHRATSAARERLHLAMRTQLSGYLLRKFKKSPGWQKLWVVFAACSLFFYKSWQDDAPLASLPLLGYCVGAPVPDDGIEKDFVFKLQFKNHVYFFRADSQYTYSRWTEVLQTAMTETSDEQ